MEIKIDKTDLLNAVNTVSKSVATKTTMTILECILITAENDEIRFTASNMELGIDCYADGQITEGGCVAVECKTFAPIVGKLPSGEVEIKVENNVNTYNRDKLRKIST